LQITSIPDRRTLDKRFKVLSINQIIAKMGNIFLLEKLVDYITASVDSLMIKAVGPGWHESNSEQKVLSITKIDPDARRRVSKSKDG
jgi:hypothetical protein